ncbi:MAG: hypothetical protein LBE69_17275 [Klebsiella sp.]|uniref:hypothetical protein n=1 Tax=Klebsiella sp. TaxID=576 RepID=UPI002582D205|nr:hypothetical protein [Klebsiella sp.]MBZ6420565.1 hypothetical protein [Klebsiella sp.]
MDDQFVEYDFMAAEEAETGSHRHFYSVCTLQAGEALCYICVLPVKMSAVPEHMFTIEMMTLKTGGKVSVQFEEWHHCAGLALVLLVNWHR